MRRFKVSVTFTIADGHDRDLAPAILKTAEFEARRMSMFTERDAKGSSYPEPAIDLKVRVTEVPAKPKKRAAESAKERR